MLSSLDEHQLLVFWVQIAALVGLARVLAILLRRIGQPAVIGELAAGLILGPSVFGKIWPSGFEWFLPADDMQGAALVAMSWIGAALLLVVTGFETDLNLIWRFRRAATLVAVGSLVIPFLGGLAVGFALPSRFLGSSSDEVVFALFIATALSISSLPVVAKILSELGLMRRNFGQINLAAGMANDAVGWVLLGIISGLAASGSVSIRQVAVTVGGMLLFLVVSFTVGQRIIDRALRRSRRDGRGSEGGLSVTIMVMLVCAVAAQYLGLEAVLGAFVAGILLGRSRFLHDGVLGKIESITTSLFAPLFFATAGLRVDLGLLADRDVLIWGLIILVVASGAKYLGSFIGARAAGLSNSEAMALGAGLNARGAMEVVIATVGLGIGVLNDAAYTVIVLMAMVTSIMAPPTLRRAVRNFSGSDEEQARLEREAALASNLVVKDKRILLPSRGLPNSIVAAQILQFAWPAQAPATVLSVGTNGTYPDVDAVKNVFADRDHEVRQIDNIGAMDAIIAESKLGFGVIGLGVSDQPQPGTVLSVLADYVLGHVDLPVLIVRRARNQATALPSFFTRCIVPVSGSRGSKAAQEVAFNLGGALGTELVLTHVVSRADPHGTAVPAQNVDSPAMAMLAAAEADAQRTGASTRMLLRHGVSVADELVQVTANEQADLVIIGASPRRLEERVFLGHTIEELLARSDATIVVVTVPDRAEQ